MSQMTNPGKNTQCLATKCLEQTKQKYDVDFKAYNFNFSVLAGYEPKHTFLINQEIKR